MTVKTQTRDERSGWRDLVPFRFVWLPRLFRLFGMRGESESVRGEERDNGVCAPARLFLLLPLSPNATTLFGKKSKKEGQKV